jgi:serine/threonine protein kinase
MNKLTHPFVINILNEFHDENNHYFLLPFLQGGELSGRIKQNEHGNLLGLPEAHARVYSFCIAGALAYMHDQECAYRDLKPENIMIDSKGFPVIVDLGLAKIVPAGDTTRTFCGTLEYMAPEVILQDANGHNCSADHWSFGALVYELLTGNLLAGSRKATNFYFRLGCVFRGEFKNPENVSGEAIDLIRKLLVKDPTHRLGSLEGGERDILEHEWFAGLDIEMLRRRESACVPWVPTLEGPMDTYYFPGVLSTSSSSLETF